jgi:molybdate transport system substrate-binding protein
LAAIAAGGRLVAVRKAADLARTGTGRVALATPSCPLGSYTRAFLQGRGLYDAVQARAVIVDNSRAVIAAVRGDQADVGLVYGSDAVGAAGCRRLFQVRRLPVPIRFEGAVLCRGQQSDQARALLCFLTSPVALHRFRRCGFASTVMHKRT